MVRSRRPAGRLACARAARDTGGRTDDRAECADHRDVDEAVRLHQYLLCCRAPNRPERSAGLLTPSAMRLSRGYELCRNSRRATPGVRAAYGTTIRSPRPPSTSIAWPVM